MKDIRSAKKIIIIGDAGRGKTTFANNISKKLNIPVYSTDNFFWKVKYTEPVPKEESIQNIIREVYEGENSWIMEGGTTGLSNPGLKLADIIVDLRFKSIFSQYRALIKRSSKRSNESLKTLIPFLWWVTKKRYSNNEKYVARKKVLESYMYKTITLSSYKEIDEFVEGV